MNYKNEFSSESILFSFLLKFLRINWLIIFCILFLGFIGVIAACFQFQRAKISAQQLLIEDVLGEVRAVREARGLDVEPAERMTPAAGV